MPDNKPLKDVLDGFSYDMTIRPGFFYATGVLSRMEAARRTNNFRPRYLTVPESLDFNILAYSTYEYQLSLTPGSLIIAIQFVDPTGLYSVQVTDSADNYRLFNYDQSSISYNPALTSTVTWAGLPLLPIPYMIGEPGLLDVVISSLSSADSGYGEIQVTVVAMEPIC